MCYVQSLNKNSLNIYRGKKVIVTGHTGFKGSWLALWLHILGAKVFGISHKTLTSPCNYKIIALNKYIKEKIFKIENTKKTKAVFNNFQPDFVFHLAAQAIVKKSYSKPKETWNSNLIGTLSVMEALKDLKKKCTAIIITSDKVYKNIETERGYNEDDRIGGFDPYSASKGATEILISSYFNSFFLKKKNLRLSVARAGNVIGGGDWSEGRLIPDCIKSWNTKKKVTIRSPSSTRPWQHVLEVLFGYLVLGSLLNKNIKLNGQAFNFGPKIHSRFTVLEVLKKIKNKWPNAYWRVKKSKLKESKLLKLNSKKSQKLLRWRCVLNFTQTLNLVLDWYKHYYDKKMNMKQFSINQIKYYSSIIKKL